MAVDIAGRILKETGSAGVTDAAIDILLRQVADMPGEERTRLARGPGGGKPSVEVVTATPLRKARQTAVAKTLAQHIGPTSVSRSRPTTACSAVPSSIFPMRSFATAGQRP